MKVKNLINSYSVLIYTVLAFAISWGLIGIIAGPGNIPINPEKSESLLPLLYVSMLVGPSLTGFLMIFFTERKTGLRKLMTHMLKWRFNIWYYVIGLFFIPALASLILYILSLFNPEIRIGFPASDNMAAPVVSGIFAGIMVGLFEEIGWTGFMLPRMIKRFSILISGLIIGVIWGLWHFILFWEMDSFLGAFPLFLLLGRLFAWLPPFRILLVWLYDRTESLLLVILAHASLVFTTTVIVPMTLTGKALLTWIIAWGLVLWVLVILIHIFNVQRLKYDPDAVC